MVEEKRGEATMLPPLLLDGQLLLDRSAGLLRECDLKDPMTEFHFGLVSIAGDGDVKSTLHLAEFALHLTDRISFLTDVGPFRLDDELVAVNRDVNICKICRFDDRRENQRQGRKWGK